MFRHLFVPIDDTDLSVDVVGNAVSLARDLGARVTFFHASADAKASLLGDAEVLRLASPRNFEYAFAGKTREILAKAEAAARALHVPCETMWSQNDKPAAAIVAAARERGCDLIFMASHGRRTKLGMALGSETLNVLMNAGLPVLVSSAGEPTVKARAVGIIRDEHRSHAAVMHAWIEALARSREAGTPPDAALMRSIVRYIQVFPVALHHPKEEAYLFKRLRARTSTVDSELDELERQHVRDREMVKELADLVAKLDGSGPWGESDSVLEQAVMRYAGFLWEHIGREEGVILPAALQHLLPADWKEIDAAFAENLDRQTDREYKQLFSRIVNFQKRSSSKSTS